MKGILLITLILEIAIVSPIPALERWQARYRANMRASVAAYLPSTPLSAERRKLLREICALPDSAFD
jgi:hypothetical protein